MVGKNAEYDRQIAEVDQRLAAITGSNYAKLQYEPDFQQYENAGAKKTNKYRDAPDEGTHFGNRDAQIYDGSYGYWDLLTEEEQRIYNYILGKYGEETADIYWDYILPIAQNRYGQKVAQGIEDSDWRAGAIVANSLGTGVTKWMEGALGAYGALTGQEVTDSGLDYASQHIKDNMGWFGDTVYDLGVTVGNMLPSILISGSLSPAQGAKGLAAQKAANVAQIAGSAAMGVSAGGSAYQQGIKQGMSQEEALLYGSLIGVSEAYLQKAMGGLGELGGANALGGVGDNIIKAASGIENGFLRFIKKSGGVAVKTLGGMGSEALEEGLQSILEPIFAGIVTGDAVNVDWSEVAYSALMGALMGGAFEAPRNAIEGLSGNRADPEINNTLRQLAMEMQNSTQEGVSPEMGTDIPTAENGEKTHQGAPGFEETQEAQRPFAAAENGAKTPLETGANSEYTGINNKGQSKAYGKEENHIDNRTAETVAARGTKAFQFDHPELHQYYVEAAQTLINDAQNSLEEGKMAPRTGVDNYGHRKKGLSYQAPMSELLDKASRMDISRPQLIKALEDIIADNGQENYAAAKRAELLLDSMLSDGYTTSYGESVEPNSAYLSAKAAITGGQTEYQRRKAKLDSDYELVDMLEGAPNEIEQARRQAEYAELKARYETEDVSNGTEERAQSGSRGEQRTSGMAAEERSGSVQGGAGSAETRGTSQKRRADGFRHIVQNSGIRKQSTASQGIGGGTNSETMYVLPAKLWTDELRTLSRQQSKNGRQVIYIVGEMEFRDEGGVFTARGAISRDGKRMWVRVDHDVLTPEQIIKHEEFHALAAKDSRLIQRLCERIIKENKQAELNRRVMEYVNEYGWTNVDYEYVLEEVLADYYADIDIFDFVGNHETSELTDTVRDGASQSEAETSRNKSPPADKYSRDPEERRRALRKGEMVNKFRDKVNWHKYYQKILSDEYNPDYFDDGNISYMELDGVLLTLEMQRNGEWSVIDEERINNGHLEQNRGENFEEDGSSRLSRKRENDGYLGDEKSPRHRGSNKRSGSTSGQAADGKRNDQSGAEVSEIKTKYSRELAPVFYSKLERELEATKQEKLGASSVVNMLRGKGVKAEEIKWSGIEAWLEGKKSVGKQELLEFVRDNQLEIEEEILEDENGGVLPYSSNERATLDAMQEQTEELMEQVSNLWEEAYSEELPVELLTADDIGAAISRGVINRNGGMRNFVGVSELTEAERTLYFISDTLQQIERRQADLVERVRARRENTSKTQWSRYTLDGGSNYREYKYKMAGSEYTNSAMRSHWGSDAKGIIVHARVQDFDTPDGKALFIEEIQSDWHNEGRKQGYFNESDKLTTKNTEVRHENGWYNLYRNGEGLHQGVSESFLAQRFTNGITEDEIHEGLVDEYNRSVEHSGKGWKAPDAPYSKTYHEYVLKTLLRKAAEGGYSYLAWTPGWMQEERWSSEFAEGYRIEYDQDIPKFLNKYGKQWGASVGKTKIYGGWNAAGDAPYVPSINITEAMKESVLYAGQARYSRDPKGTERTEEERKKLKEESEAIRSVIREELDRLGEEYGWIKAGENPAREVKVPRRTADDKKVSQTVRTVMEAHATPNEALPKIEELIANGEFSYEVYGDEQAQTDAEEFIRNKGWDNALSEWLSDIRKGNVSKRNTATGWLLYDNAVNNGNVEQAMNILTAMVGHQRSAAQALQATRILKKLSPETQLYGVQRSVANLQQEINDRHGKKTEVELKVDEELAQKFMEAQTEEERDKALIAIYKDIGRQMPSTFEDKFRAFRYLSMLTNPRTHVRNLLGNAFFMPVVLTKDVAATVIEGAVHFVSGGKTQRSKSIAISRDLLSAAWNDFANAAGMVSGEGKYNDYANANKYIEEGRQIFKKNKPLEAVRKANSTALETEDMWFSKPHYAFALAQYCKAHGITADQLRRGKALGMAREYAVKEARKATYRDTNALSNLMSRRFNEKGEWGKAAKVANAVVEGVLPFRKTPANILVRGIEYSPIGLLNGIKQAVWDVHRGNKTSAEAIDSISAGLTGTGLMGLGMYMAAQGLIRGRGGDDEKEKEFEELMGHQSYALELPNGKSYTLDWLAPEALPFFIGVNLYELIQSRREDEEKMMFKDVLSAVFNVTEPMLEMNCLQSLNDLFEAVGYASSNDMNALMTILSTAATSYLTQALPTVLGQIERSGQGERMTTYTERNSQLSNDMQYFLGKVSAKFPGWDYNQIPYIDAWGRTESTGGVAKRIGDNFLNPAYTSQIEMSAMEEELLRLYEDTGEASVLPSRAAKYFTVDKERKDLTAEEYVKYATEKGQTAYQMLTSLVGSSAYQQLDDALKVEAIGKVYDYANVVAKMAVSEYEPTSAEKWVTKAIKTGGSTGLKAEQYIVLYNAANDVEALKDAKGESIDLSRSLLVMQMIYNTPGLTEKQRQALFADFGVSDKVIHYNKSLVENKIAEMKRKAK